MITATAGAMATPLILMAGMAAAPPADKGAKSKAAPPKADPPRPDPPKPAPGKPENINGKGKGRGDGRFPFTPFTVPLPLPVVKQPISIGTPPYTPGDVFHGIAPEYFNRTVAEQPSLNYYEAFPTKFFEMRMRSAIHEIIPGVPTPIYGYDGLFPGPTFRTGCISDLRVNLG